MQEKDGIALQDFLEHYQLELHLEENESSSLQFYVKDGEEERPLRCDIRRLKNEKGQHLGQLFVFSDAALETDLLTGFQEWESFQRFVKERKDSFPPSTGIAMCDINGLSVINSTMGTQSGDQKIRHLAESMRKCFPKQTYYVRGTEAALIALCSHSSEEEMRSLSAEVAQLGALTVEDENGVTKINGGRIDTDTLFAQDITATGTITGAQLIGAILSGNAIDIQAVIDATSIGLKTELVDNSYCLVLSAAGGTTKSSIALSRGSLKLVGQSLLELSTNELYINANTITDGNYGKGNYTSFSGSVVSDGTLTVTKKFGVCYLNGGITLTAAVSGWVTLLDSDKVPAPQNGEAIIMTLPSWKAPTTNPARLRIPADGGLQITRGSANAFWINLAYPIN